MLFYGRSVGIRTRGLLDPNQARYQTSPHPVSFAIIMKNAPLVKCCSLFFRRILTGEGIGLSYRIDYDIKNRKKYPENTEKTGKWLFPAVIAVVLVLLFSVVGKQLFSVLLPGQPEQTSQALEIMAQQLQDGASLSDAFAAFCKEVIELAGASH